ncbi:MAG: flagellar motor protein MotB [Thermohalobaculum sp.]|nr:flagellar motor protein MotB [Thermohalobaculum sp.]
MAKQETARPLIVKRVKKVEGGHHGGAWKVAYADFVTAMMAFFLLMWLLNATSEEQRKGIADYFDPTLPISRTSAGGAGMLSGDSIFSTARLAGTQDRGIRRRPDDPPPDADADQTTGKRADAPPAAGAPGEVPATPSDAEEALSRQIETALAALDEAAIRQHFRLRITPEGLVIEIVDLSDQPLFAAGSAHPSPVLGTLLGVLAPLLDGTTNDIAMMGHTDALPFAADGPYTNWELSADRANAARRLITSLGLAGERIVRVSGLADTDPFDPDPAAPQNRRISVVVLREGRR